MLFWQLVQNKLSRRQVCSRPPACAFAVFFLKSDIMTVFKLCRDIYKGDGFSSCSDEMPYMRGKWSEPDNPSL